MSRWYRPESLAEALRIRSEEPVVPLAGATDLYVRHRRGTGLAPAIDAPMLAIAHLAELRGVEVNGRELRIGAATTWSWA